MLHTNAQHETASVVPINFLWLELTNQCNLQCVHCYAESGPNETATDLLTADDYRRVMEEARGLGCAKVQFIGGEPTLNRHLPDLIRHAHALGYEYIEVYTNLMRLPDDLATLIRSLGVHVATSVYGATPDVHNSVTLNKGSHARTMGNLLKLKESGVPVRASVIAMPQNADHVDATVAYLEDLGIRTGKDRIRSFGRADEHGERKITELCGTCANGTMRIGPDGSVSPCIMSAGWSVGSVRENSLAEILGTGQLQGVRKEIYDAVVAPQLALEMANCPPTQCVPYSTCVPSIGSCNPCGPHGCSPCRPTG